MSQPDDPGVPQQDQIVAQIRQLLAAEASLQSLLGDQVDTVTDPRTGRVILLPRAQNALLESQLRFNRLIARMPLVVFELDFEGTVLFVNIASIKSTGYGPDELLGKNWWEIFCPGEAYIQVESFYERLKFGDLTGWNMSFTAKDGTELAFEIDTANRWDEQGKPLAIVGVAVDVTTRKRAEGDLALRRWISDYLSKVPAPPDAYHTVLKTICESLGWPCGAIWIVNERDGLLRCLESWSQFSDDLPLFADAVRQMTFPRGTGLPGRVWETEAPAWISDISNEVDSSQTQAAVVAGIRSGFAFPIHNGNRIVAVLEIFFHEVRPAVPPEWENVAAICTQLGHLIEHKRVDQARVRFAAIIDSTPDFVGMADPNSRVLYLNLAARQMIGIEPEGDVSELRISDLHSVEQYRHLTEQAIPTAVRDGGWKGETVLVSRAGRKIPLSQVILAHKSDSGALEFLSTIASDISERKRWEEELRQSQKMEAVGKLAGGIAHDFNNILTVILGYGEFLLPKLAESKAVEEPVFEMVKAAKRAAKLTQQLLAFGRKQVLCPVSLDLNAVVNEMQSMLARLIGEGIECRFLPGQDLFPILADQGQLEQVIMNLVVNARDAMSGSGTLIVQTWKAALGDAYVRLHPYVRPGNYTVLSIKDTGCGMDKETERRAFEPYFTTKKSGEGTGLGLSTVFGIVKQSGGSIEVLSELGVGTTFEIFFPESKEVALPKSPPDSKNASFQGTETILFVEDEPGIRRIAKAILESKGYTVLLAESGEAALEIAGKYPHVISLVLSDVFMPRMGGGVLVEKLRALRPGIRALFTSGYTDDEVVRHGVEKSELFFLQKPFTEAALCSKVRQAIDSLPIALK